MLRVDIMLDRTVSSRRHDKSNVQKRKNTIEIISIADHKNQETERSIIERLIETGFSRSAKYLVLDLSNN